MIRLDIQGVHNWRQSQTMWNVLNFARHDANIFNPRTSNYRKKSNIKRYEFPIMQWCIGMVYRVLGENIIIARLIMFTIGLAAIIGIYFLILHFTESKSGALIGSILFQYSPLFYLYTINPIPDILALTASIWYCVFSLRYIKDRRPIHLQLSGGFILLATLAKLPYIMFAVIGIVFILSEIYSYKKINKFILRVIAIKFIWILPALIWYVWVIPTWGGNSVIKGIFNSDIPWSEYQAIFNYHREVMFPKIILNKYSWPLFIVGSLSIATIINSRKYLIAIMAISFIYLIFEFAPIGVVHDYYMLPFLISFYSIIGIGCSYLIKKSSFIFIPMLMLCIINGQHTSDISTDKWSLKYNNSNPALYTHTNQLKSAAPQNAKCIILNDISTHIFSYKIDKMGYVFAHDNLRLHWIEDMIKNYDVEYMYSDSKKINNDPDIDKFICSTLLTVGNLKVFKLNSASDL